MSDSEIVIAGSIARHYSSPTNNPMGYIQSIHNLMIRSVIFLLIGSRGILVAVLFLLGMNHLSAQTNIVPGTVRWEFKTSHVIRSSAATDETGTVYFGGLDGSLYALNSKTGIQKWKIFLGNWIRSSPALDGLGGIYVGCYNSNFYGINEIGRAHV